MGFGGRMSGAKQRNRTTLDGTHVQYGYNGQGGRHIIKTRLPAQEEEHE